MDGVLGLVSEVLDMHVKQIAHDVVEHEETGSFLNGPWPTCADEVKDRRQDLVHSLDVFDLRVEPCKDEEDAGHVIVVVGLFLLLICQHFEVLVSADELVFLSSGGSVKRDDKLDCRL